MNRRAFLALGAASAGLLSGCPSKSGTDPQPGSEKATSVRKRTASTSTTEAPTETATETETTTRTPREHPNTIFVGPDGDDENDGRKRSPVETINEALHRAQPGHTIYVKPGQYFESLETERSGEPGNPITITGPPEAVISGVENEGYAKGFGIGHSHIHITGTSINGLQDPSNPGDATSYMDMAVNVLPLNNNYLTGLVIKPHGIGNVRGAMIKLNFVNDVEIGEFRVIGPCGLDFLLEHRVGHFGEIVYAGNPPNPEFNDIDRRGEIGGPIDASNDIHIHHIDNSTGHGHIELVDVKAGCHDVTVEYCTSTDARLPSDNDHSTAVHVGGHDVTFRWNRIVSPADRGVDIGNYVEYNPDFPHPDAPKAGTNNAVYGNSFEEMDGVAINYTSETSEEKQRHVCGNTIQGDTEGTPTKACPDEISRTDTIGHLGGDSPWN